MIKYWARLSLKVIEVLQKHRAVTAFHTALCCRNQKCTRAHQFVGNTSECLKGNPVCHKASSGQPLWVVCEDFVVISDRAVALKSYFEQAFFSWDLKEYFHHLSSLVTHPCATKNCFEARHWINICQNSIQRWKVAIKVCENRQGCNGRHLRCQECHKDFLSPGII